MSDVGFVVGGVDLLAANDDDGYTLTLLGASGGSSLGKLVPVTTTMEAFLADGAATATQRVGVRTISLAVLMTADSLDALAKGEAALDALCVATADFDQFVAAVYQPNDADAAACRFTVSGVTLDQGEWTDVGEIRAPYWRKWVLTLTCLPFAQATTVTTVTTDVPDTSTVTVTTIDDCSSTDGWTVPDSDPPDYSFTLTEDIDALFVSAQIAGREGGTGIFDPLLRRTGLSVSVTAGDYIRITVGEQWASNCAISYLYSEIAIFCDGVWHDLWFSQAVHSGNDYWFRILASGTLTQFYIRLAYLTPDATRDWSFSWWVSNVALTNAPVETTATGREQLSSLTIDGTRRTPATLEVTHGDTGTGGLGDVLLYTRPRGTALASPPLRQYLSSGQSPSDDSTAVSGHFTNLTSVHKFDVPAGSVRDAMHQILARVKASSSSTETITWSTKAVMGDTVYDGDTGTVDIDVTTDWQIVEIALTQLPAKRLGNGGYVRIELSCTGIVSLDNAWHYDIEHGQLTWVDCGTGTVADGGPYDHVWCDAASLSDPVPRIYLGGSDDRGLQVAADLVSEVKAYGRHQVIPPGIDIDLITTGATDAVTSITYARAYNTHVVKAAS